MARLGIIGSGIVGLSTALNVQKLLPKAKVTIIADKFGKDTTSHGAAGFFRPYLHDFVPEDQNMTQQWYRDSWHFYSRLAQSSLADETGQTLVSGLVVYNKPQDEQYSFLSSLETDFHQVTDSYLKHRNLNYKYGYSFTTVVTQMPKFLAWLVRKFCSSEGIIQKRTVQKLSDLIGELDVVVNCSGLRAKELADDQDIKPVRGHVVMVSAPWIKHFFLSDDGVYLVPHDNKLIIGGTKELGNYSVTPDSVTRNTIIQKAVALFPQLKDARVIDEWVGLRPSRQKLRFEVECLKDQQNRALHVLHNYGHGGHGISLGWGSGIAAAKTVQDLIGSNHFQYISK
ncbi:D-aspartate oxidase-like [Biomphalaria glabrata]|uniref:D-aspartate oxidase-like n=1 Tax=Biomphalaria glabrata TaxID=6526 RepID=A0A9W3AUA9_BIOGL|nr:D-aspartate oxidase-like [Biomphalaria glabrata]XP_055890822.1 D-aspartate oxidase-like [Biomphalaria glabrata]